MSDTSQPDKTPGIFAWNELITHQQDSSKAFYCELFGWTSTEMPMPDGGAYTMFMQGEKPIAGCVTPPVEATEAPPMWLSYINVADIDASVQKARDLGAKICQERVDLPMGSFAIITDPAGATFAFWQASDASCE